jgi:aspartyl protease family protein
LFVATQGSLPYDRLMDFANIWDNLAAFVEGVPRHGLLLATLAAVLLGVAGSMMRRWTPSLGRLMRGGSTVVLGGILVAVVFQLSRFDPRFDIAIPEIGLPEQTVEGGETHIPLAPDGHFWVRAEVNGVPARFLVDTGATLTTLNADTAELAGLKEREGGIPVMLQTANGSVAAKIGTIEELSFGSVTARGLDAAIAPNIGPTNVLGMNLLSRLRSWRVENNVMILQPHHPQPAETSAPAD